MSTNKLTPYECALLWYGEHAVSGNPADLRTARTYSTKHAYDVAMRRDVPTRERIASAEGHRRMVLLAGLTETTTKETP